MRDIPIIMSAPMVLSTLREIEAPGTGKTMTRRLSGKEHRGPGSWRPSIWATSVHVGDRLWVRESFWQRGRWAIKPRSGLRYTFQADQSAPILYATEVDEVAEIVKGKFAQSEPAWHLRPSIFLPRERSRLTLIVTATKIERLLCGSLGAGDAEREGLIRVDYEGGSVGWRAFEGEPAFTDPTIAFNVLWDRLHGKGAFFANPEVVAITFRPVLANVTTLKEAA